jgi:hypothetical protein
MLHPNISINDAPNCRLVIASEALEKVQQASKTIVLHLEVAR